MPKTKKLNKTKKLKKTKKGKKRSRTNKTQIGGNLNTKFMDAIIEDDLPYIKENIINITDLSFENSSGDTPLDIAIAKYNDLKTTEFMGDDEREIELYSIRTQIIRTLLKNGANGENIEIPGINFNKADLQNVKLKGANLSGATLEYANLDGSNLENANLSNTDFQDATIRNANLTKTRFNGANLDGTNINGSTTTGTDFTGTMLDMQTPSTVFRTTTDLPQTPNRVFRTTTDLPQTPNRVFRTTTDLPQTPENSVLDESEISIIETDPNESNTIGNLGDIEESFDIPETSPGPLPNTINDDWLLGLMGSANQDDTQSNNENELWNRMETVNRETEQERNERLKRERNEKKQNYLQRPEITLTINNTNPFERLGLSGYHALEMEDISFCDYITEKQDNVIFIYDQQVGVLDKPTIRKLITSEILDETYIVYECRELSEAFVPHEENIISGPMLNMRILAINGLMIPLNELDEVVNGEHQIFVIETGNDKPTIPIASLPTRLAMGDNESGQAVVSANHCQAEVSIKVGNLSYIENRVLLDQCSILGRGKIQKTRHNKKKTKRVRQNKSKRSRKNKKKKNKSLNK
tara:strand:+ start:759 stop:2507 length:1749 start_codon:yes stop_codon:yes gene_type:complete